MIADVHRPFRVVSDASDTAIGAFYYKKMTLRSGPCCVHFRGFRPEESNCTIMERETLAAIHALRVWDSTCSTISSWSRTIKVSCI